MESNTQGDATDSDEREAGHQPRHVLTKIMWLMAC